MHHLQETLIPDMPLKILVSDCSSKTEGHEDRILSTNIGLCTTNWPVSILSWYVSLVDVLSKENMQEPQEHLVGDVTNHFVRDGKFQCAHSNLQLVRPSTCVLFLPVSSCSLRWEHSWSHVTRCLWLLPSLSLQKKMKETLETKAKFLFPSCCCVLSHT